MKTSVNFRFSTVYCAIKSCLKAGASYSINLHQHYKKRKNNELLIFTI
jgi:hypothetical protein